MIISISFFILLFIFLLGLYFEFKIKSPFLIFYLALIVLVIYPSFLNVFVIDDRLYPDVIYMEANLFCFLYLIFLVFFRLVFIKIFKLGGVWRNFILNMGGDNSNLVKFYLFSLMLCFLFFIYGLKIYSVSDVMSFNWWGLVRSDSVLVVVATYLSYLSCGILVASYLSKNKYLKLSSYLLTFLFLVFSVFVLKTRSYVLMFLVPLFLYLFYGKRSVIKPMLFLMAIGFLFVLSRAVRHSADLSAFLSGDFLGSLIAASEEAEYNFINAFYYFIYFNNSFEGFENNYTLFRILLFWIPSLKPPEFSYLMHSAYYGSLPSDGLSMHPTVFGDAYANAWWFGAFIYSMFLALYISILELMARCLNASRNYFKIIVFSIVAITSLIFSRGAVYNAFMYSFIPIFLSFIVIYILNNILKLRFLK